MALAVIMLILHRVINMIYCTAEMQQTEDTFNIKTTKIIFPKQLKYQSL